MSALRELTRVLMATPGPHADDDEVAAWYALKAQLFDRLGAAGGAGATEARRQAALARRHADWLRHRRSR